MISSTQEQPVLAYWNFASAPVSREQISNFIEKMEEKIVSPMHVSFVCDVRHTDTSVINLIEQEHPNFAIYHASPLKTVDRVCSEMTKHASLYEKPGLIVLISDSGEYHDSLVALVANGWNTMMIFPGEVDYNLLESSTKFLRVDDILDKSVEAAPVLEARCFLIQIPSVPEAQLDSFLSKDQQCVYFNSRSREAVIVVEAENNELIQKSLENLIQRVCMAVGVNPAEMLPFPQNSLKRVVTPGVSNGLVQLMIFGDCCQPHSEGVNRLATLLPHYPKAMIPAQNKQFPRTYGPEPAPQSHANGLAQTSHFDHGTDLNNNKSELGPIQELNVEPNYEAAFESQFKGSTTTHRMDRAHHKVASMPDFISEANLTDPPNATRHEGLDPFAIGAAQLKERDRAQQRFSNNNHWMPKSESYGGYLNNKGHENKIDVRKETRNGSSQLDKGARFNGDPWKQAEDSFIRRMQHVPPSQELCEISNSDETPNGAYCDSGIHEGNELESDREHQPKDPRSDYFYMPFGNKQNGQKRQRDRFRKPAPQCVFWENRHHRQETGCTLWHPRESCRFYPTCTHQARDCGFAHPFCGPRCSCVPSKRNPQMNHWTDQLEKNFGALISP